jgi:hypothetical protein
MISKFLNSPAPVNPQTGRPPAGFGQTMPGYTKDAAGNWTTHKDDRRMR